MIIDCISDLHGYYPKLEGGDLLIVAGDLTARDEQGQLIEFGNWLEDQKYTKKIFICGNHDNRLEKITISGKTLFFLYEECIYLSDSGTEFEGLKIWGSPWTKTFKGMNPHCKAFTVDTEEELAEKWGKIPNDIDILITHSPPFGNFDYTSRGKSVGSLSLWMKCLEIRPKLHIFGHIHEAYGQYRHPNGIHLVNCSHVNEHYQPVNKPIRIEL